MAQKRQIQNSTGATGFCFLCRSVNLVGKAVETRLLEPDADLRTLRLQNPNPSYKLCMLTQPVNTAL